jgi:hypothetical protein
MPKLKNEVKKFDLIRTTPEILELYRDSGCLEFAIVFENYKGKNYEKGKNDRQRD